MGASLQLAFKTHMKLLILVPLVFSFAASAADTQTEKTTDAELVERVQEINQALKWEPEVYGCPEQAATTTKTGPARWLATKTVASNNPVADCLKKVTEGSHVRINRTKSMLCKRSDSWWKDDTKLSSPNSFTVSKLNGQIVIAMDLFFKYKGDPKNRTTVLARLGRVKSCMAKFYQRFGLKLDLDFKVDTGWSDWASSDIALNLWDKYDRANSANWIMTNTMLNGSHIDLTDATACGIASHELGHLLGLNDRYVDSQCPDRKLGPPDDIMRASGWTGLASERLYPDQLQSIIRPLCGG